MIVTESYEINGKAFVKTYSNIGMLVERDGVRYSEANDPAEFNRIYTETDEPIETEPIETDEATEADYQAALAEFGVEV